jgi:hypothetical protein
MKCLWKERSGEECMAYGASIAVKLVTCHRDDLIVRGSAENYWQAF